LYKKIFIALLAMVGFVVGVTHKTKLPRPSYGTKVFTTSLGTDLHIDLSGESEYGILTGVSINMYDEISGLRNYHIKCSKAYQKDGKFYFDNPIIYQCEGEKIIGKTTANVATYDGCDWHFEEIKGKGVMIRR
jgi:hypothetical protein